MKHPKLVLTFLISICTFNNAAYSQWVQTNGPGSGRVAAIAIHDSIMVAGVEWKGIFYSLDQGAQWTFSNSLFPSYSFWDLFFYDTIIFAGTEKGIFISHDNGQQWSPSNNGFHANYAYEFVSLGEKIFVASDSGIFISENAGADWTESDAGILVDSKYVYAITAVDSMLYAGTNDGLLVSTDSGQTWEYDTAGLPFYTTITAITNLGDTLLAGSIMSAPSTVFMKVGSNSWIGSDSGLPNSGVDDMLTSGSLIFALVGGEVYESEDGGISWFPTNEGLPQFAYASDLEVQDSLLVCGSLFNGVYKTNVGEIQWSEINNGLTASHILAILATNDLVYASNDYGNGLYETMDGNTWMKTSSNLTSNTVFSLAMNNDTAYAGTGDGFFKALQVGGDWSILNNYMDAPSICFSGENIYIGSTGNGMRKSIDNGSSWSNISDGLPIDTEIGPYEYYAVLSIAKSSTALMAGTLNGLYISVDDGENWTNAIPDIPVSALIEDSDTILAGSINKGLFRSIDGGLTWNNISLNIGNDSINCFLKVESSILAGTEKGIYLTHDNGNSWAAINEGFPAGLQVRSLSNNSTYLCAGTFNSSVWKRPLAEIPVSVENIISTNFNYKVTPNPASTTITLALPSSQNNILSIFNLIGEKVKEEKVTGTQVTLDVSSLQQGLYLVRTENRVVGKFVKE